MINKKGKKTDRTVMMENVLFDYFYSNYSIFLELEKRVSSGVADMMGFICDNNKRIIDAIVIEIKQSAQDFYSGHGLNFVGSSNYIAVPSELVGFAIEFLRKEKLTYVGVLEVTDKGSARTVIYPNFCKNNDYIKSLSPFKQIFTLPHLRNENTI